MSLYFNDLFMYVSFHSVYLRGADTFCQSSLICIVAAQSLGCVQLLAILWTAACPASLPITISLSLLKLKFAQTESVMPSNHLILCCPLLLMPSVFPSIRFFFSNESALGIRWPKYWSFGISPSNEYSGLISSMVDWFDLAQILKNLLTDW